MTSKTSDHSTDSVAAPPARGTATAKIAVRNSETRPYDESAGPVLAVLSLDETFSETGRGNRPCGLCSFGATMDPPL